MKSVQSIAQVKFRTLLFMHPLPLEIIETFFLNVEPGLRVGVGGFLVS